MTKPTEKKTFLIGTVLKTFQNFRKASNPAFEGFAFLFMGAFYGYTLPKEIGCSDGTVTL
jgi:hypothetical protein